MRKPMGRKPWVVLTVLGGLLLATTGCDPQLKATIENGVITASTSLFGAVLRALVELGQEAQDANDPNS